MHQLDKHNLQTLGFTLIFVGFLLFTIALWGGYALTDCPLTGCPSGKLPWYWVGIFAFFSGIALIIIGIILLIIARRMNPEPASKGDQKISDEAMIPRG